MLVRLFAKNFLSFDEPVEFSMVATKEVQHGRRVSDGTGLPYRILQTAAIWGPNASGKSNFCRILEFIQNLVVDGTRPDGGTGRRAFRLRKGSNYEPTTLEFEIMVNLGGKERIFRYSVALNEKHILKESLTEIRTTVERIYFSRTLNQETGETGWKLDWWEKKSVSEDEKMFARFVAKGTKINQLFLHEAMDRNLELLSPIFRWFRDQLIIVRPDDDFLTLTIHEPERAELRKYAASLLSAAGSGITSIEAIEVSANAMGMPAEIKKQMLDGIKNDEGGVIVRSPDGDRFSVFRKDGDLVTSRLVTFRQDNDGTIVPFELSEESDGTRRLFDLSPLFHELDHPQSNKVFVIDEFDRSIHGLLSRALLDHYYQCRSSESRAQLIFSTHDLMLMDQTLLRRDEMWFVDRSATGSTAMQRLSEQKNLRYDKDIRKSYLEGSLPGFPFIKTFTRREAQLQLPGLEIDRK
jgi:AAA15 family ATPase/GTPase